MSDLSWAALVRLVHQRANLRCEYCHTSQKITGQAMHVDDVVGELAVGEGLQTLPYKKCPVIWPIEGVRQQHR